MKPGLKNACTHCVVVLIAQLAELVATPAFASDRDGLVVEPELAAVSFDDGVLSGSTHTLGLNLAYAFRSHYEVGLNYSSNQIFPLVLTNVTNLDQGGSMVDEDELEVRSQTLYARLNWHLGDNTTAYVMIGESDYELKSRYIVINTFFFVPVSVSSLTRYRSKISSTSVGLGLQWRHKENRYFTLKYIDHSDGDFEYSSLHLGQRFVH